MNGSPGSSGNTDPSASGSDWATQMVDTLESVVGAIRSKTSDPLVKVARYLVYGLIMAALAFASLLLLTIGAVRFLDSYLPGRVWAVHLLLGALFVAVGRVLWTKRKAPTGG